jgi:phosphatidylglycerophosphate synthase
MNKEKFNELLQASLKSEDTEEWLDVHFNRPIGLAFALASAKLGIKPNTITILSIFLGVAAGVMFSYTDLMHNIMGVILLMFANFGDSTDGQLARLTNQKSLLGRALDGVSGDVWFFAIYAALAIRMQGQMIPFTNYHWGIFIWILAFISGILCHSTQASLSDYYRQIHLFFLLGKEGSELDNSAAQREIVKNLPKEKWFDRLFHSLYGNYCHNQEKRTPNFQRFFEKYKELKVQADPRIPDVEKELLEGSRPLMAYTNLLTFNSRAIALYITALLNCPWVFLLFEIIVLTSFYIHMHHSHERLCGRLLAKMEDIKS